MEADKPFDSTALADTLIRSSDNVHFYVLGDFLRYVSPTFRDIFSLSRGSAADENEIQDGYPVIPLSEDKETIHYLLNIIYPYINKPKSDDSRLLMNVWKMAEKYGMDMVVGKLQKHLLSCMDARAHKVFVIAIIFGWKDGAETAKRRLAPSLEIPYCDEFKDISGTDYYGLLEYHFRAASPGGWQTKHDESDTSVSAGGNLLVDSTSPSGNISVCSLSEVDIILRSLDGVDFYVSRPFLPSAFDELFSNANGESKDGLTVVRVTDDSKALHHFLCALHQPMNKPPVENPGLIADICMVARKYRMPIVEARLREQLATSLSMVEEPLCVYAIATTLGWGDLAKAAAKNTLNAPVEKAVTCIPELQRITGADLYCLIDYRIKCSDRAAAVLDNSSLHGLYGPHRFASHLRKHTRNSMIECSSASGPNDVDVENKLRKCPRGSTYTNSFGPLIDWLNTNSSHEARYWSVPSVAGFFKCCKEVAEAIEQAIDEVVIPSR
jgi:hypothetical protein